ncbi:MAG: beta-lactamase family protein [Anaerolineales bacterium]|nr:MAG: beta-lactamase family protein [Anaerolineales bacterium]
MNTLKGYRILFTLICLTLLLALSIGNVKASTMQQTETDFAAMDAYVTEQMENLGIPGMALGIVQEGQIAHVQGFGVADSSGRAVTPQTPFYIGSVTKSFTALAVMQLVEAGKIDLEAPIQTYLPWFELADKQASAKITVRNLLNQTSGISTKDGNRFLSSQQGLEEIVRGLNFIQLSQPVGTTYQYSNLNYSIAGLIVEVVSGQSYAEYVTQHIFEPLDMRHSYTSRAPALEDGLAAGHHYMFGYAFEREYAVPPSGVPEGFLIASVEDMTHYVIAHLSDGSYGDTSILSAQGIAALHAAAIVTGGDAHYAMGWSVGVADGIPIVMHSGDTGHFHSVAVLMPDRHSGFVLLANASGFEQLEQVDGIASGVFNLLNGKSPAPVSLPIHVRFLYWAILLTPILMILGMAFSWRRLRNKGAGRNLLVVPLYCGVALLWLVVVPQLTKSSILTANRINHPELSFAVLASAVLGFGWSVIFTAMNLRRRKLN